MMKIKIDHGMMLAAISDQSQAGGPEETAFLNRRTGEIVFLTNTADVAKLWYGTPTLELAAHRAAVENRPSDWVQIPKYVRLPAWARRAGDLDEGDAEEFIADFFRENGIDAEF